MTTLVVDSAAGMLPKIKTLMDERGLPDVILVRTAREAHALIEQRSGSETGVDQISLVIIDGKLDDGDGFELCRQIRKLPAVEHAWIILLVSSVENKTAIDKARHSGADDYAVKPYDGVEFLKHFMLYANRKTALLVEDDPVISKLVAALLHKKHLQLLVTDDGLKAYNLINTIGPPRLVLLDIGLPGMNGVKLVQHIRTKNLWRKTPVLMLTGSKDVNDVKGSLGAGANDYIVKPFQIADFNKRLDKFLGTG